MKIRELIEEGISDIVYHYTPFQKFKNIISTNKFNLSLTLKQSEVGKSDSLFYLSTTRSRLGDYHQYVGNLAVLITLDGRKLSNQYKGKPIDYWQFGPNKREMEDRIFSDKDSIPNAMSYMKQVDIYIEETNDRTSQHIDSLFSTYKILRTNNVPVFIYTKEQSYLLGKTSDALSTDEVIALFKGKTAPKSKPASEYDRIRANPNNIKRTDDVSAVLHGLIFDNKDSLPEESKKTLYKMVRYYHMDGFSGLAADLHNALSTPTKRNQLVQITKEMRKNNITSVKGLGDFLYNKWKGNF